MHFFSEGALEYTIAKTCVHRKISGNTFNIFGSIVEIKIIES